MEPPRADTIDSVPSQTWNPDEDGESPYIPVRYSLSEPDVIESVKAHPCRSHSAPTGVIPKESLETSVLPPKPYHSRPAYTDNEDVLEEESRPKSFTLKLSQSGLSGKNDQAKVPWEHGINQE